MATDTLQVFTSAPAAEINFDVLTAARQVYTLPMTRNFTVNFRASANASLSSILNNQMIEVSLVVENNATGKWYPNIYKVDNEFHYPLFVNAVAPKAGTSSRKHEFKFKFFKVGSAIISLGTLTMFGDDPSIKKV